MLQRERAGTKTKFLFEKKENEKLRLQNKSFGKIFHPQLSAFPQFEWFYWHIYFVMCQIGVFGLKIGVFGPQNWSFWTSNWSFWTKIGVFGLLTESHFLHHNQD